MFALVGGVVITLGTVATQYGWAYVGLLVTEVMASSLKVVIGTTLNYFLDGRINRAEVPFPGVVCFLIAACLGSLVHFSNAADNQEKLSNSRNYSAGNTAKEDLTQHLLQEEGEGTRPGDGRGRCCCWKKEHAYGPAAGGYLLLLVVVICRCCWWLSAAAGGGDLPLLLVSCWCW